MFEKSDRKKKNRDFNFFLWISIKNLFVRKFSPLRSLVWRNFITSFSKLLFFKFITLSNINTQMLITWLINYAGYEIKKIINDTLRIVRQILTQKSSRSISNIYSIWIKIERVNFNHVINQWTFSQFTQKHNRLAVNIYHVKLRAYIMILRGFTIAPNAHLAKSWEFPPPTNSHSSFEFLTAVYRYSFEGTSVLYVFYIVPLSVPFLC